MIWIWETPLHDNLSSTPRYRLTRGVVMACATFTTWLAAGERVAAQQYGPNAGWYASITTQQGATLKSALASLMITGPAGSHIQTDYGQGRDYLPFTDALPGNPLKMREFYTGVEITKPSANWIGFTGVYDSREHVWPDAQQGSGDTTNSSTGSRGDIHMLKPLRSTVNGDRGNKEFGGATATGTARVLGTDLWYPGDIDRGDAARICLYADTRWGSTLKLVDGYPAAINQMGDKQALLRFHYLDVPDLFERRRNDVIQRGDDVTTAGDDSGFGGTRNRNAYIDHPEYAWSVFVDQANDTQLTIDSADATSSQGGSTKTVSFGRVLRNAAMPAGRTITLNKDGVDGTYYSVTPAGSATSSVSGGFNAFAMDASGLKKQLTAGLSGSTATPGAIRGTVTIDNLDITAGGGVGRGGNDVNDVLNLELDVLAPSNGSFRNDVDQDTLTLDLGTIGQGSSGRTLDAAINNLVSAYGPAYTAGLALTSITPTGDSEAFTLDLPSFNNLAAGGQQQLLAGLGGGLRGTFDASYVIGVADELLPGTRMTSTLTLNLMGRVALFGDANYSDTVDFNDLLALASHFNQDASDWSAGNFNGDGRVDFNDLLILAARFNTSAEQVASLSGDFAAQWALAQAIAPEPAMLLAPIAFAALVRRRRLS